MEEKATEKQISFGKNLNIEGIDEMTKAEARLAINRVMNKDEEQVEVVKIPSPTVKAKNGTAAMYVSYAKDLVVAGMDVEKAMVTISLLKANFE